MADATTSPLRVRADGKFFRVGDQKFYVKGVGYGPFAPGPDDCLPPPAEARADLVRIAELGANVIRVYTAPPRWLLDLAAEHGLRLLVDIPWPKNRCFLDSARRRQEAREAVLGTVRACAGHPAVFAFSVVNEIPPDIVRWSGPQQVTAFIEELVDVVRERVG